MTAALDRLRGGGPAQAAQRPDHRRADRQPRLHPAGRARRGRGRQAPARRSRSASRAASGSRGSRWPGATASRRCSRPTTARCCCRCSRRLGIDAPGVGYDDLGADDDDTLGARHGRTRELLAAAAGAALIDHPLLTLEVAGQTGLPRAGPDRLPGRGPAARRRDQVVRDRGRPGRQRQGLRGRGAGRRLRARAAPAARRARPRPELVSHDVVLVCPENFSLPPGRGRARRPQAALHPAPAAHPARLGRRPGRRAAAPT